MNKKIDLEKKYGEAARTLVAESGYLGMLGTSTLKAVLEELSEKRDKTKEDEDVIKVMKEMIKHRSEE